METVSNFQKLQASVPENVLIVAVSKMKPESMIQELYNAGHRDFGENKVQDMARKQEQLPKDVRWHMIGHLQTNKVKYMAPFVHLVHGIDSLKLLKVINKEAIKNNRSIDCLLQVHIAKEQSKFGFTETELMETLASETFKELEHVSIRGLMGMATYTPDLERVRGEFKNLKRIFDKVKQEFFQGDSAFDQLSMGMSADYQVAIEEGSTMVRVGSAIFGLRNYS